VACPEDVVSENNGQPDGTTETPLPRALALRVDTRQAVILNMMVALSCAVLNRDAAVATRVARSIREFVMSNQENSAAATKLRQSLSVLAENLPADTLQSLGICLHSFNEIRALGGL
jgi:hypothetical protein